jgi:hypothetical protein
MQAASPHGTFLMTEAAFDDRSRTVSVGKASDRGALPVPWPQRGSRSPKLAHQNRTRCGAIWTGIDTGYRGAPGRRGAATEIPGERIPGREQAWRKRQSRHRCRGESRAGWIDAWRQYWRSARNQYLTVLAAAIRSAQGHRARDSTGLATERARGESGSLGSTLLRS